MKNIQKIALALLVGIMAIGFSAFTSLEKENTIVASGTYYHIGDEYVLLASPPSGLSCKTDTQRCTIQYTATNLPDNFSETAIPSGAVLGSAVGSWQP